jgi:hypothetical protein
LTERKDLERLIAAGTLFEWSPTDRRKAVRRVVLLRHQPFFWLSDSKGQTTDDLEILRAETCARIDAFVWGDLELGQMLKEIGGRTGVCEWKQDRPKPGLRIFGTLYDHEVFIGSRLVQRIELPFKRRPDQGPGVVWRRHIQDCRADHDALFPGRAPLSLVEAMMAADRDGQA